MDTLDCPNLGLSDHSFRSSHAFGFCTCLGDNRCPIPEFSRGVSPHRRPTHALYFSQCPVIAHCLALGAIGRNNYHCFPTGMAFVGSNSSKHFSGSLSSGDDNNYPWSTIPGVLVAIKKECNPSRQRLTTGWSGPGMRGDLR